MKIQVMQEDIDQGEQCSILDCPVAKAIARKFSARMVGVNRESVVIDTLKIHLPENVRNAIEDYDNGGEMNPFEFELPI